jgi:hypothetical protein
VAGQHFTTALRAEAVACLRGFDCAGAFGLRVLGLAVEHLVVAFAEVVEHQQK